MPLEAIPLTQELLEDWRTRTRLGQREYRRVFSKEGQLKDQLAEAKVKAFKALNPEGYPLFPPRQPIQELPRPVTLHAWKAKRELPVAAVVKPNVYKSRMEWERLTRCAPWFGSRPVAPDRVPQKRKGA
eukprot:GGOE01054177.1.p2 GENE.GGOE01054177.1~~GGOE01054177.1.p2  ORF type:complete len:129 (+),score=26.02 GGOE01054177.1:305-691(+)